MNKTLSSTLILAIPGTQETQELPRETVLEAIRRGEIGLDRWVWSHSHNDWKPLAEIRELQVAPGFAHESAPTTMAADPPGAGEQAPQKARVAHSVSPRRMAPTVFSQSQLETKHEFPFVKVVFVIAFLAVTGVIAANYYMVDKPFAEKLATTHFGSVQAFAHLGAFAQPNALVIHILPTNKVNSDNFANFLAALAKSTPPQPFNHNPFDLVGLTASWQSQYVFEGADWEKLGQMQGASSDEKKRFEIEHLKQLDGSSLVKHRQTDDPAAAAAHEAEAWQALVAHFQPKSS